MFQGRNNQKTHLRFIRARATALERLCAYGYGFFRIDGSNKGYPQGHEINLAAFPEYRFLHELIS